MQNENEQIIKAKNGDQEAFGCLALIYRQNVFGMAYRMIGDYHEAEDITQSVFIRAYLALSGFASSEAKSFKSWLLSITYHQCIDYIRKRQFKKVFQNIESCHENELFEPGESITEIVLKKEEKHLIQKALDKLQPKYRTVIVLKYMEDLDYQEIAQIMKIPVGTVGTWIRRGLEKFKSELLRGGNT